MPSTTCAASWRTGEGGWLGSGGGFRYLAGIDEVGVFLFFLGSVLHLDVTSHLVLLPVQSGCSHLHSPSVLSLMVIVWAFLFCHSLDVWPDVLIVPLWPSHYKYFISGVAQVCPPSSRHLHQSSPFCFSLTSNHCLLQHTVVWQPNEVSLSQI